MSKNFIILTTLTLTDQSFAYIALWYLMKGDRAIGRSVFFFLGIYCSHFSIVLCLQSEVNPGDPQA